MKKIEIFKNNIYHYDNLPDRNELEVFTNLITTKNLIIESIISNGWNKVEDKWYDQENDEWVLLLKGIATLEFENNHLIELVEGDYILISSHQRHKVIKTSSKPPCIWLAIHFNNSN